MVQRARFQTDLAKIAKSLQKNIAVIRQTLFLLTFPIFGKPEFKICNNKKTLFGFIFECQAISLNLQHKLPYDCELGVCFCRFVFLLFVPFFSRTVCASCCVEHLDATAINANGAIEL